MWDVAVIGAGPAGTMAAGTLLDHGLSVVLIDKSAFPRNKSCGGGLPDHAAKLLDRLAIDWRPVQLDSAISSTIFYDFSRPMEIALESAPVRLVSRKSFDQLLLKWALQQGDLELLEKTAVSSVEQLPDQVVIRLSDGTCLEAGFLVAAGGAGCPVGTSINPGKSAGVAVTALVNTSADIIERFSSRLVFNVQPDLQGYGWVFPKKHHLNIGIGGYNTTKLKTRLRQFVSRTLTGDDYQIAKIFGHPLPFYQPDTRFCQQRTLLAGDAARLVDALTGEGIYYALVSGRLAGQTIARVLNGELTSVSHYEKLLQDNILSNLHWSCRIARLFYDHPEFFYQWVLGNRFLQEQLKKITSGLTTYQSLQQDISDELGDDTFVRDFFDLSG